MNLKQKAMNDRPRAARRLAAAVAVLGFAGPAAAQSLAGSVLDIELGAAWQDKNEVQIPNDASGTRFALDRVTGDGPFFAPRIQFSTGLAANVRPQSAVGRDRSRTRRVEAVAG